MEMINYVPKMLSPDLVAINRTVNRQREAMLAKAKRKTTAVPEIKSAQAAQAAQNQNEGQDGTQTVAEGGPT